ncbi:MAG: metallophosphoesterase [Planctomycetes bacterium]|nr:metallophosphoesterase [Planctomycetota bacterium]
MTRRIFVGDIQGCRAELEQLLELARFDPSVDELHPVGDLVNRGPDSLGTLRLLRSLGAGGVLGNHDLHLLRAARAARPMRAADTFGDVLAAPDREPLLDWLASLPFARSFPDVFLVHAGISPLWSDPQRVLSGLDPLKHSPEADFATRVRHCDGTGRRPERDEPPPAEPFRPWFDWPRPQTLVGRTIVFGHWAVRGLVVREGLRGLDSGCVWGKALSAWIAEEDRVLSVPARRAYAAFDD